MDVEQYKRDLMAERKARIPGGDLRDYECPICGWHVSSHGLSGYGLDCPPGIGERSPAAREGRLPCRG